MYRLLFVIVTLTWPLSAVAQQDESSEIEILANNSLTISDVVAAAFSKSPDALVIGSKAQYADALGGRASSWFSQTPSLSVVHQNDRLISDQGLREWEGSFAFPLWMPGERSAAKRQARMSQQEASAYERLAMLNVTGQIREVLWELALSKSARALAQDNVSLAQELDRDIERKIVAGNLPRQDRLLSQKELMSRKMALVVAEAEYIHAAIEYESLTGLREMPAVFDEMVVDDTLVDQVPIIALYNAKVDFMEAKYQSSKKSWASAPTVSMGLKRETGSFLDQNIDSIGVGLSLPLGAGVHMTSKRSEAALALAEMERQRALIERQQRLQLHEAEHELEVCEINRPLSTRHYEMASENLRLSQKAFDMGEVDLIDLLKIQDQYFAAAAQFNQQNIECKRAIARHNQIKGVPLL